MTLDERDGKRISKFLSLHLRHEPEQIGLVLERGGWAEVDALLRASNQHGVALTRALLDEIVSTSDKQRFAYDADGTRIRANQGHSVEVDLELEPSVPPDELIHGTARARLTAIRREGLQRMNRHHVHLYALDRLEVARKTGSRHGVSVVLRVDARAMVQGGVTFFRSVNDVWLVEHVPPQFLSEL